MNPKIVFMMAQHTPPKNVAPGVWEVKFRLYLEVSIGGITGEGSGPHHQVTLYAGTEQAAIERANNLTKELQAFVDSHTHDESLGAFRGLIEVIGQEEANHRAKPV